MKSIYLIVIASILGIGASLLGNYYIKYQYEIDESISKEVIEKIYGELLDDVESLYYIENDEEIKSRITQLNKTFPTNLGILKLSQRDKGIKHFSYGVNYFGYEREMYPNSYYYQNSSFRSTSGLIRGYVENRDGDEIDSLKYERVIRLNGKELDIQLVIDYKKLQELVGRL